MSMTGHYASHIQTSMKNYRVKITIGVSITLLGVCSIVIGMYMKCCGQAPHNWVTNMQIPLWSGTIFLITGVSFLCLNIFPHKRANQMLDIVLVFALLLALFSEAIFVYSYISEKGNGLGPGINNGTGPGGSISKRIGGDNDYGENGIVNDDTTTPTHPGSGDRWEKIKSGGGESLSGNGDVSSGLSIKDNDQQSEYSGETINENDLGPDDGSFSGSDGGTSDGFLGSDTENFGSGDPSDGVDSSISGDISFSGEDIISDGGSDFASGDSLGGEGDSFSSGGGSDSFSGDSFSSGYDPFTDGSDSFLSGEGEGTDSFSGHGSFSDGGDGFEGDGIDSFSGDGDANSGDDSSMSSGGFPSVGSGGASTGNDDFSEEISGESEESFDGDSSFEGNDDGENSENEENFSGNHNDNISDNENEFFSGNHENDDSSDKKDSNSDDGFNDDGFNEDGFNNDGFPDDSSSLEESSDDAKETDNSSDGEETNSKNDEKDIQDFTTVDNDEKISPDKNENDDSKSVNEGSGDIDNLDWNNGDLYSYTGASKQKKEKILFKKFTGKGKTIVSSTNGQRANGSTERKLRKKLYMVLILTTAGQVILFLCLILKWFQKEKPEKDFFNYGFMRKDDGESVLINHHRNRNYESDNYHSFENYDNRPSTPNNASNGSRSGRCNAAYQSEPSERVQLRTSTPASIYPTAPSQGY